MAAARAAPIHEEKMSVTDKRTTGPVTVMLPGDEAPITHRLPGNRTAADQAAIDRVAEFRKSLIQYRKDQGVTHPQLAKLMNMHLGRAHAVEEGDPAQWRLATLFRYAEALGVEIVLEFKPKQ